MAIGGDVAFGYMLRGHQYKEKKQFERALRDYEKAMAIASPTDELYEAYALARISALAALRRWGHVRLGPRPDRADSRGHPDSGTSSRRTAAGSFRRHPRYSDPNSYGDDSVDLYLDEMPADEVWDCTACHAAPYGARMSYTSQQYQVFMGGTSIPTEFRLSHYDEATYTWVYRVMVRT